MKRLKKIILATSAILGGLYLLYLICLLILMLSPITGRPYFNNAWDRAKLREIANPYEIVVVALREHHVAHGVFPETIDQLDRAIPNAQPAIELTKKSPHTIRYRSDRREFEFYVKLNWDGGLFYQSAVDHWTYDAGNGEPDWPIR